MAYRKWIALGLCVLGIVGLSLWGMWRLLDVRQRTQEYLLEVMSSMTEGGVSAETVKIGEGAIELQKVRASSSGMDLEVERVGISYHLLKLLFSGFDPKASIYEVTLHRPQVVFLWDGQGTAEGEREGQGEGEHHPLSPSPPLLLGEQGIGGVRVRFSGGKISVRRGDKTWSPDCEVSGWIEGQEDGGIAVRLQGRAEHDGGSLFVQGTIDRAKGVVGLKVHGTSVDLERWGKALLSELGVKRGRLDLKADVVKDVEGWRLTGEGALSEGVLDLGPRWGVAESVSLKGTFADSAIIVEEGRGVLKGHPFRCSGRFRPLDPWHVALDISFPEVDIESVGRGFLTEKQTCPTGRGMLDLSLSGPIDRLVVHGRWTGGSVLYGEATFEETSAAFRFSDDTLSVDEVSAHLGGGSVSATGWILLDSTKAIHAAWTAEHVDVGTVQRLLGKGSRKTGRDGTTEPSPLSPRSGGREGRRSVSSGYSAFPRSGLEGWADATVEVTGTTDHPTWRAEVRVHEPVWAGRRWSDLTGKARSRDGILSFTMRNREIEGKGTFSSDAGGSIEAEAKIGREAISILEDAGIPVEGRIRVWGPMSSLRMEGVLHLSGDWVNGDVFFSGVRSAVVSAGASETFTAEHAEHAEHTINEPLTVLGGLSGLGGKMGKIEGILSARALRIGHLRTSLDGKITVGDEAIRLELSTQDGRLALWGEMERGKQAEGERGRGGEGETKLDGERGRRFSPPHPLALSPPLSVGGWGTERLRGEMAVRDFPLSDALKALRIERRNGTGLLDGQVSFEGLKGSGALRLTDGLLEGVAGLEGKLAFEWDEQGIRIQRGFLRTPEETLLSLERTQEGGLRAKAEAIHASSLLRLLHPRAKSVGGLLTYDVSFAEPSGLLKADFDVVGGHIKGIGFDRLEGHLSGHLGTSGSESLTAEHAESAEKTINNPLAVLGGLRDLGGELSVDVTFEKGGAYKGGITGKVPLRSTEEMALSAQVEGDVLALLSGLTEAIPQASGKGRVDVQLAGPWDAPVLRELQIVLEDGSLRSRFLVDRITKLKGKVTFDLERRFVGIEEMSGRVDGGQFWIKNVPEKKVDGKQMTPLVWDQLGVSFGVLALGTGAAGVELAIPGLMREGEKGRLQFLGKADGEDFYIAGPTKTPRLRGKIKVRNGEFTYPFLPSRSGSGAQDAFKRALKSVRWDMDVVSGEDVWYFRDAELAGGGVHLKVVEGDVLAFHGSVVEKTLWLDGDLKAAEGTVSYLDTEFQVEEAGLEVNTRYGGKPILRFRAKTTVYDDSTHAATDIYLEVVQVDERTGARLERARWGNFEFSLRSSDPKDDSQEKILAKLGYVEGEYDRRAWGALTLGVESYLLRPLLNPMERKLRRALGLDVVRFRPSIARNLLHRREVLASEQMRSDFALFQGTQWTLGQYVTRDWYLFYTGQLEIGRDADQKEALGIKHRFGLEYRLWANTQLQFEYDYDDLLKEEDRQIRVRHWFPF